MLVRVPRPVPLTEQEIDALGIASVRDVEVDFGVGDSVVVTGGVWKDTVGVVQSINEAKQIVTINVELVRPRNAGRDKFRRS